MEPLSIIVATLAAKCTINCITETIFGGLIEDRAGKVAFETLPAYTNRLLSQFKSTPIPVNHDLQKAILSSHWMATKVMAEQMMKKAEATYKNVDAFIQVINVAKAQLILLKKEGYKPELSPDTYQAGEMILKDPNLKPVTTLKGAVIEFHLAQLRPLLGTAITLLGYEELQENIRNGFLEAKLEWFELVSVFLNELLKGDNNKAKDAFQNQELAKIGLEVSEIKQAINSFERLATSYIKSIGKERFEELMVSVKSELTDINASLIKISDSLIILHGKVDRLLEGKELNLNNFPDYRNFISEISELNSAFVEKQAEKQETIELLTEEKDERKRKRFEKDLAGVDQELIKIDEIRLNKTNELAAFRNYIQKTWLSLNSENSPISPRLLKARELFEKGDLAGANSLLDPQILQNDYDLLKKTDELIKQKRESLSKEFLAKANFTVLEKVDKSWFDNAKIYYTQAIELHEIYDTCFAFASFLQNHKQILEAAVLYEKALKYIPDVHEKAITLNNLAILQSNQNEFDKAQRSYEEALAIRRELADWNPQTYLSYVATTLNNLANLQSDQNELDKAQNNFEEALTIYRKLDEQNPQIYLSDVAMTLNNLAILQSSQNEFDKAQKNLKEALIIRRNLAERNPQIYLSEVAIALNNLANLQRDQNELEKAQKNYQEALAIYRKLAERNPQTYLSQVAIAVNNLAILQSNQNEFDKAKKNYQEALTIRRELAERNPQTYLSEVATTLNNLGLLQRDQNELDQAQTSFEEALAIYRNLAERNPQIYLSEVATTLINLGLLQMDQNELGNAQISFEEALAIYRDLVELNPQTYLSQVATTLNNLGLLQRDQNELDQAQTSYEEALAIYRNLVELNPQTYLSQVATTLNNLGLLQRDKNELEKAQKNYQEALAIYRELAKLNPQTYLSEVAMVLNNIAILQRNQNELEKAQKNYQEALAIYRELVELNPQTYLYYVATTLNNMANLQRAQNEFEKAKKNFEEALAIYSELAEINPMAYQISLAKTLNNFAVFYLYDQPKKDISLSLSYNGFLNAYPYCQQVSRALQICKAAIQIWHEWGEDLIKYLDENGTGS